ncbi:hypothetical protein AVEN_111153-1 [Araneus ventricosus]|uniref:Uncharacterized protein n=1 Tax=Araneus ventricosus TaxID=182803 RepID=A0A4Y2SCZ7_ARAVE|nr:hypothetical protein AVEN_111153-1 [Araneus ventricosus]
MQFIVSSASRHKSCSSHETRERRKKDISAIPRRERPLPAFDIAFLKHTIIHFLQFIVRDPVLRVVTPRRSRERVRSSGSTVELAGSPFLCFFRFSWPTLDCVGCPASRPPHVCPYLDFLSVSRWPTRRCGPLPVGAGVGASPRTRPPPVMRICSPMRESTSMTMR